MRAPSAKTIAAGLGVPLPVAERVRQILKQHSGDFVEQTLADVESCLVGTSARTFGGELVLPGEGDRSPSIEYLNRGDTYATTVLYLGGIDRQGRPTGAGRWAIGSWGDIVEKGAYA